MNILKAFRRDKKIQKRKNGMRVTNRSIFTLEEVKRKKYEEIRKNREAKDLLINMWLNLENERIKKNGQN